jgi:UDP-N-acetyl-D-galactosamine dehydrogenase
LAGRRINDGMADHVAMRVLKMMATKSINVVKSKILILGFTFKENCSDIRNTQVRNLCLHLIGYKAKVEVFDPLIGDLSIEGVAFIEKPTLAAYDAIVLAVAHNQFKELGGEEIRRFGKKDCVIFDVKGVLCPQESDGRL